MDTEGYNNPDWAKELEKKEQEWRGRGEVPQEIEFCSLEIEDKDTADKWLAQFKWAVRVLFVWDTFREQVIRPPRNEKMWTREEYHQMIEDLQNHPEVTYAHPAGPADST